MKKKQNTDSNNYMYIGCTAVMLFLVLVHLATGWTVMFLILAIQWLETLLPSVQTFPILH